MRANKIPALDAATLARLSARVGQTVDVRVTPSARQTSVALDDRDGALTLKVSVTCAPEDGKANKAVLDVLARALNVAPSRLSIIRGETSRDKVVRIDW
jgi:uncharacterized protein (TIGR00251 family)